MLGIIGYNFLFDKNALDISPTNIKELTKTKIQNGVFDHINITNNIQVNCNINKPQEWDFSTILDCDFNENIDGGNIKALKNVTSIKIKRRKVISKDDEYSISLSSLNEFDWITIAEVFVNTAEDYNFKIQDFTNINNEDYEYALVPTLGAIEGSYITDKIHSEFSGVFICDTDAIYKLYTGVEYGDITSVNPTEVFNAVGSKYPIVVSNGDISYQKGSVKGTIVNVDTLHKENINRKDIVNITNSLNSFLKNKKAKILKDWNGNAWLIMVVDNPTISFDNNFGMGVTNISFNWVEQGNPKVENDLRINDIIQVVG